MKKILLSVMLAVYCMSVYAQKETKTLINKNLSLSQVGFVLSPGYQATKIGNTSTSFFQAKAGIVFGDKFTIGGFYGESFSDIRPSSFEASLPAQANLDVSMGGGYVECTLWSNKLVHLTFPLHIGMLNVEGDDFGRNVRDEETYNWFVEPAANIEVNLHKYLRLFGGVGYRLTEKNDRNLLLLPETGNELTFNAGLKLGMFRFKNN